MARYATSFSQFVDWSATNAPQATMLDWWRRLDSAIRYYFSEHRHSRVPSNRTEQERQIGLDPALGSDAARMARWLRRVRNKVAHEDAPPISREQAVAYAQHAHRLIWALGFRCRVSDLPTLPVEAAHA